MLRVENYTAGYADNQFLFNDISFELELGQIVGVVGTNGCGKSTFMKGLFNLVPNKKGKIFLDGDNITNWPSSRIFRSKSIAYLSQRDRVFNHLTVNEHVKLYHSYSKDKKNSTDVSHHLLSLLQNREKTLAANLSGGEQLILGLLCVAILDPEYVFLDEPSDSLDVNYKEQLLSVLSVWKHKKAILLVEQNLEVLKITDTNLFIKRI